MHKTLTINGLSPWSTQKRLLMMFKFSVVLFFLSFSTVFAEGSFAQTVTLQANNISLSKAMRNIKKQTGVSYFLKGKDLANIRKDVDIEALPLSTAMDQLVDGLPADWILENGTIVIKSAPNPSQEQVATATEEEEQPDKVVRGKVTDENGAPLTGVTIKIKGGTIGTITDQDGQFSMEVPDDAELEISFLGFESQEVSVADDSDLNISLASATTALEQMVVVGYGSQKKENLTGSISTIDMSTKSGQPITNVSNALYGTPGLYVNLINSSPGVDRAQIRVRGIGNLNATGSDPLVLVDGIEYPLNEINPNDIESMSVLKDASAAIYGSKAANGVILITTKKGEGEAKVDYKYYYGNQQPTFLPDAIWDPIMYMKLFNQAEINEGKGTVTFSDAQIQEYEVGMHIDPYTYPSINWFDKVLENGNIQKHDLSVSKSTDGYSYRASIGYLTRDGIFIGDGNKEKKYYFGLNSSLKVSDKLDIGFNLNGNYRSYTEPSTTMSTFLTALHRALPVMPDQLPNGDWAYTWLRIPGRNNWENPMMYLMNEGKNEKTQLWTIVSLEANYKLPLGITYKAKFGVDKYDSYQDRFYPKMAKYQVKTGEEQIHNSAAPISYNYDVNNLQLHFYNTLSWDKSFNENNVAVMLGASYDNYGNISFSAQNQGFADNVLQSIGVGNDPFSISGSSSEDVLESYFGRIDYDYEGKYLVQGIFRFDGSSRFAPGHRWGFFPGISAGWRIDKESFFKEVSFVDLLKLRTSIGQSGSQAVALYSYENDVTLGHDYSFGGTEGELASGAASTALADPTTSWETTTDYDLGVDIDFWRTRFHLTVDLYKRLTKGVLRTINIPDQVGGLSGPKTNVGEISNKGYEVSLAYRNEVGMFSYSIYGDVSYNKNNVENLEGEIIYNNSNSGLSTITREGSPVSSFYLLQTEGIFQSDEEVKKHATQSGNTKAGYLRYKDVVEDGIINDDDRVNMGVSAVLPDYNYGFGFNVGYKGLELSAHFQGVGGYYVMPGANLAFPFNNGAGITWEWATDSWTPDRPDAKLPIITEANYGDKENFKPSDFWLRDASYLRLKSVQLAYTIPETILSKVNIKALSVFINAENWLTFTSYKDSDPEGIFNAGSLYHYPMLKTINGGVNITF